MKNVKKWLEITREKWYIASVEANWPHPGLGGRGIWFTHKSTTVPDICSLNHNGGTYSKIALGCLRSIVLAHSDAQ